MAFLACVVAVGIAIWLFDRGGMRGPAPPRASAFGSSAVASKRLAAPRRVRFGGGPRQSVALAGAEQVRVAEGVLGALEGRVRSLGDGRPIAGAKLTFAAGTLHTITSDARGAFRFLPPREGVYELALAIADGHLPFAPELGHSPLLFVARRGVGLRGADLFLTPSVNYTAVVVDGENAPVVGACVRVMGGSAAGSTLSVSDAIPLTDAQGETTFVAVDGSILEAEHELGVGRARVDVGVQIGKRLIIRLGAPGFFPAAAGIGGTIRDGQGNAIPDALATARFDADNPASPGANLVAGGRAVSDEQGQFHIAGLDHGRKYVVVASAAGYAPKVVRGVQTPGEVEIRLTDGVGLFGEVRDAATNESIPSFVVMVARPRGGLEYEVVAVEPTLDPEGRYAIPALPEGTYRVTVSAAGYAVSSPRTVELRDEDVEANFGLARGGAVSGRVTDAKTMDPIEGAKVSLDTYFGGTANALPLRNGDVTNADGRFELRGVGPALVSIFVVSDDYHARVKGGLSVSDGERIEVEVALTPVEPTEEPRIELAGIGALLSAKGDALLIGGVVDGGGAAEVGLGEGDAIMAIEGVPVSDLGFSGSIQRIRGPEGSSVRLLVVEAGAEDPAQISVPRRRLRAK